MSQPRIDFDQLARDLLGRARELLPTWLPGGKFRGHEFVVGNLRGEPGESLSININTGKWADFADEAARGGDLISLYAAIHGLKQGDAAKELGAEYARLPPPKEPFKGAKDVKPGDKWTAILPVPEDAPKPSNRRMVEINGSWVACEFVARWPYRDAEGRVLGYDARFRKPDGAKEVVTQTYCRNAEGKADWKWKGFPEPRPLYGLDKLAARAQAPVMLGEGCKTVDAQHELAGHVYVTVGWPGGAQAIGKVDWTPLHGRRVLLWPDADAGGVAAMQAIAAQLKPHCPEVKILDVAGQPEGWDAADAFVEGWSWQQLLEWAKPRAKVYVPPAPDVPKVVDMAAKRKEKEEKKKAEQPQFASAYGMWEKLGLVLSNSGSPIPNLDNTLRVLEGWPDFKGALWYDEFSDRILTTWRSDEDVPREWSDSDTLSLTVWLQRDIGIRRAGDETVAKAVRSFARKDTRNGPRDWMESLVWDETERISQFFPDVVGADENDYTRAAGHNLFLSMVARVYQPGCMVRQVIVLEGAQELGKSTLLHAIGGDWYMEVTESVNSPEFFLVIQGKLLCEIGELDSFSRAETTRIKQVISNRSDRFRAKYDRNAQDHPRKCIFIATTNEDHYLRDATGGTRFLPIRCSDIRLDQARENRVQYFAEAVHRFKAGAKWWEVPKQRAAEEQEKRRQQEVWEEPLEQFLLSRRTVTTQEIMSDALKIDVARRDHSHAIRIAKAMRALGWFQVWETIGGKQVRCWKRTTDQELPLSTSDSAN